MIVSPWFTSGKEPAILALSIAKSILEFKVIPGLDRMLPLLIAERPIFGMESQVPQWHHGLFLMPVPCIRTTCGLDRQ